MINTTEAIAPNSALDNLLPLLQRLDQLLESAIASAQLVYGTVRSPALVVALMKCNAPLSL
jgi:hypothetical protein